MGFVFLGIINIDYPVFHSNQFRTFININDWLHAVMI